MKHFIFVFCALCLLGALLCPPAAAEEDCRLQIVASVPLEEAKNHTGVAVEVIIAAHTFHFLVDTGSPASVMTEQTADTLGLTQLGLPGISYFKLFGGEKTRHYVGAKDIKIGGTNIPSAKFIVVSTERLHHGEQYDGLIGADFLSLFDADFDFAAHKLNLFLPHRCSGRAVYWTENEDHIAKFPFALLHDHINLPVVIDGKKVDAILDTGSSSTVMDMHLAETEFGLTPQSPNMERLSAADDPAPTYRHTFKTLQFGGVTVNNVPVLLIPRDKSKVSIDLIIGMREINRLHLFIAYKERMLYVTAAGEKRTSPASP